MPEPMPAKRSKMRGDLAMGVFWFIIPLCILGYVVASGWYFAVFRALRTNARFRWADVCSGMGSNVLHTLWMAVCMTIVTILGGVVPFVGIWLSFATSLIVPLHRDHSHLGFWSALKYSVILTHRYFCSMLGFYILCVLMLIPAAVLPPVLFFTVPITQLAMVFLYHHLVGINGVNVLVNRNAPCIAADAVNFPLRHAAQDAI